MPLECKNLWYTYDGRHWILKGINLAIGDGVLAVLSGPNASGKTTLLKVLGGIYKPQRGTVTVDGVPLWPQQGYDGRRARLKVVYVHDKPIMVKGTVLYNAALGLVIRGTPRDQAEEKALEALEELGIKNLANKRARELSAGQKQLVAIARALAVKPKYLLLDEPTSNLDRAKRRYLVSILLEKTHRGTTILAASHDPLLAAEAMQEYEVADGRVERVR